MELTLSRATPLRAMLLVLALVLSMLVGTITSAPADTAGQISTRNIILGAAAVAAGIILYNNYQHRVVQANTVVGRTEDGGIVYGDGRIVYPNSGGIVVYTSNNGTVRCTFNGVGVPCQTVHLYGYFPRGYTPPCWPPGHCKHYWKVHHENEGENENENGHDH